MRAEEPGNGFFDLTTAEMINTPSALLKPAAISLTSGDSKARYRSVERKARLAAHHGPRAMNVLLTVVRALHLIIIEFFIF